MSQTAPANQRFHALTRDRIFTVCLGLTLAFFIWKGMLYAVIGSFVPLLFIAAVTALLFYSLNRSPKAFRRSVGVWSVLVILWASVRLLLIGANTFIKPIPEGHVDGQLGVTGLLLSLAFLAAGICMWRRRKGVTGTLPKNTN